MINRDKFIVEALNDLDISPTMEKNARDKYQAMSEYLDNNGLESDFYPQGSFLIGTVIKPFKDGENCNYDLDVVAILKKKKEITTAKETKNSVGDCIKSSTVYNGKLEKEDSNCWTLQYADVSPGIGFTLDIVPSVDETNDIKNEIQSSGVESRFTSQTVAITQKGNEEYTWLTSNPLGFGDWFIEISNRHLTSDMKQEQLEKFSTEFRAVHASVEEIPNHYYRSNLQRAVQMVKRHRDLYYDRSRLRDEKPSSILLTALIADSVKDNYFLNITEIIQTFIKEFNNKSISIMKDGKVLNPGDLRQDLMSDFSEIKKLRMLNWVNKLENLTNIQVEQDFKRLLHNNINENVFEDSFEDTNYVSPTKPWTMK